MSRYLITFSYDGSNYHGYQRQPNLKTIQGVIEEVLTKLNNDNFISLHASGRTDARVHALNQKAHFDLKRDIEPFKIKHFLNSYIGNDLYIKDVIIVDDSFHARFDVLAKEYLYKINLGTYNPLMRNIVYQYNYPLNIKMIKKAIRYLKGTHDFIAFTNKKELKGNSIRTLFKVKVMKKRDELKMLFLGNGFLKHQVRNMVGALIDIGSSREKVSYINNLLLNKVEIKRCAKPEGLYLNRVIYKR